MAGVFAFTSACANLHITKRSQEKNSPFTAEWQVSSDTTISFHQIPREERVGNVVGIIQIANKNSDGSHDFTSLEVARIPGGYAAQTRLFETEQSQTNLLIGHDHDHGMSASVRWSWKF